MPPPEANGFAPAFGRKRIMTADMTSRLLIIDDDLRLHELLASYLRQHAFEVARALDGLSGLAMLDAEPFDAVLLDVMMPGIDGLEVCRRIRKKFEIPVI